MSLDIGYLDVLTEADSVEEGIWFVTDIHLKDTEMRTTKGAVINSSIILENILEKVKSNTAIKLVILAGDVQDRIPKDRRVSTSWKIMLNKIKEELLPRLTDDYVFYREGVEVSDRNPLISLKGNHDISKSKKYTFFDEISDLGIVGRYDSITVKGMQINLVDYGNVDNLGDEKYKKLEGTDKLVGLFHDTFLMPNSPKWVHDNLGNGVYTLDVLVGNNYDLALTGHIHDREDMLLLNDNTLFWQVGCIARTSYESKNKRDIGYSALIDVENVVPYAYDIDVLPYNEYFTEIKNDSIKKVENEFKNFSLNTEEITLEFDDYEEKVRALNIREDVKEEVIISISKVKEERK